MNRPSEIRSSPPWLEIALHEEAMGIRESGANSRILEYLSTCSDLTADELGTDATAWCAAFANWCMLEVGLPGTGSSWARDWFNWGLEEPNPTLGTIVVWKRSASESGEGPYGHVSFLLEDLGEELLVLGGNQSNQVGRQRYPRRGALRGDFYSDVAFRRPG